MYQSVVDGGASADVIKGYYALVKEASENSELIVSQAKNKALAINEKINKAVSDAAKLVSQANERLKSACVNYDSSTVELKSSVDNLVSVLNSLAEETK